VNLPRALRAFREPADGRRLRCHNCGGWHTVFGTIIWTFGNWVFGATLAVVSTNPPGKP